VRELSIIYDKDSGRIKARLVEVKTRKNNGTGKAAVDLGETVLMACAFNDGSVNTLLRQVHQVGEAVLAEGTGKSPEKFPQVEGDST